MDIVDKTITSNEDRLQGEADSGFKMPTEQKKQLAYLKEEMSEKIASAESAASAGEIAFWGKFHI